MKHIAWLLVVLVLAQCALAESAPADGLYTIGVASNARMFKVVDCILRVEDAKLTAVLTMSSSGYGYLYQGTSAEADAAPVQTWTPYFENADGKHRFAIEIPYLDGELPMASWSIRYEKWYDRTLQFFSNTLKPYAEIAPDGVYSGAIASDTIMDGMPCLLYSRDGEMTLELDVGGAPLNVNGEDAEAAGNAARVALPSLDMRVPVQMEGEEGWLKLESISLEPHAVSAPDGSYSAQAQTDSALLRFTDCRLNIVDGEITALLRAKNNNFDYLYLGPAAQANGNQEMWIPAVPDASGVYTYEIPIASLDNTLQIATYSAKKKLWYDRELTIDSQTLIELE